MSGNAEPYGREGLPLEEARRRVLAAIEPITATSTVPLPQALGRVSAAAVLASEAVPGFRASIMDGYALGQSHQPKRGETWQLKGRSTAGQPFNGTLTRRCDPHPHGRSTAGRCRLGAAPGTDLR